MKKTISILFIAAVMGGTIVTGCQSSEQKVDNAQNKVINAKFDLNDARIAYHAEIENYRKITANKIAANNKSLSDFKARIEVQKYAAKEDYKKKISELEQKNSDLKKTMDDYKEQGKENWEKFKSDLNKRIDELALAFKDLTKINNI